MAISRALRYLFPLPSWCSGCAAKLHERRRGPCPRCGVTARHFQRFTQETLGQTDRVS